jgi:hypothetical protein
MGENRLAIFNRMDVDGRGRDLEALATGRHAQKGAHRRATAPLHPMT